MQWTIVLFFNRVYSKACWTLSVGGRTSQIYLTAHIFSSALGALRLSLDHYFAHAFIE